MFSLIITIIGIALVAALAFAVYVINKASRQLDEAAQRLIDEGPTVNIAPVVSLDADAINGALSYPDERGYVEALVKRGSGAPERVAAIIADRTPKTTEVIRDGGCVHGSMHPVPRDLPQY